MQADVIVVTFHSGQVLPACLHSLRADPSVDHIIVVNNSADVETSEVVARFDGIHFIQQPTNVGFGRGVNVGRPYVRNRFVVVANPDTVQLLPAVSGALAFMADHRDVAIMGPRLVSSDGSLCRSSWHDLSLPRAAIQSLTEDHPAVDAAARRLRLDGVGLQRSERAHRHPHSTDWVTGAFLVCRIEALDQVDWFDESMFLFGEDGDLCRRVREAGWEVWYAPIGKVCHIGGHSRRQLHDEGRALFHEARHRELLRVHGAMHAEAYRYAQVLRAFLRILRGHNPAKQPWEMRSAVTDRRRRDREDALADDERGVAP